MNIGSYGATRTTSRTMRIMGQESTAPPPEEIVEEAPRARAKRLPLARPIDVPAHIPSRMVNEVVYCERLFSLMWSQQEFVDNVFTVEGRSAHVRTDEPSGSLPNDKSPRKRTSKPKAEKPVPGVDPPMVARSVWLSSDTLGLTAKIDLVEATNQGRAVPVETKRSAVPNVPERAYLPERVQVALQALLLREHGYTCDVGVLYFAKSRARVEVPITDELVDTAMRAIARARELAARPELPPPLQDSPKCRGCSLVEVCLPDEVLLLQAREAAANDKDDDPRDDDLDPERVRRLYAPSADKQPLYVTDPTAKVRIDGDTLVVDNKDGKLGQVGVPLTSEVVVMGRGQITTQAMHALFERGASISFLTSGGWFMGRATGHVPRNVELRLAQMRAATDEVASLALARSFIFAKIKNQRTLLRRNDPDPAPTSLGELDVLATKASNAENQGQLLGLEGAAARLYFQSFTRMLKPRALAAKFVFERRSRRPPTDPINALLSFTYALLCKDLVNAVAGTGLDAMLGFFHQPRFGRPSLALDLMEEMRPLIADSVVLTALNGGMFDDRDFFELGEGIYLRPQSRRNLVAAYERRLEAEVTHPAFGYRLSYRRLFNLQARLLTRVLLGEIDTYPAFRTR